MVRLNDDLLFRRRGLAPAPGPRLRPILFFLIFASCALMLLSRLDHSIIANSRWKAASWLAPVLEVTKAPVEAIRAAGQSISSRAALQDELERLRQENRRLANWEWRARQLETKLADLEAIAKVAPEQKLDFVTSRVIADLSGTFVRNVVIDAGRARKVQKDYPVVNADGLVGRVLDAGPNAARVLLATDLNSRIPVAIGPNGVRAILAGDNSAEPRLIYLPDGAKISAGDEVSTSGIGGLFPAGLHVGVVAGDDSSAPRVALKANLDRLTYVSVLFYMDPAAHLTSESPNRDPGDAGKRTDPRGSGGAAP